MNYFDSYLGQWASLTYDDVFLNQELQAGRLDETLAYVLRAKTELKFYRQLYQGDTGVRAKLLSQAQAQLDIQEKKIVEVFVKWFENHEVIGDKEASVSPEVIVVLGANEPTLTKRIVAATLIIKQHPSAVVVLSGGGFNPNKTESTQMKAVLLNYSLPNQILVEDDSMDTLGNAIFTKLLLLGKGLLSKSKNILVITSRFHALRAEHYFEIIFNRRNQGISGNEPKIGKNPKQFNLAVQGVKTTLAGQEEILGMHELVTEYQAETTLNIFPLSVSADIDDEWVLLQLFKNHALYKNRYDLLRKYIKIISNS